MRFFLICNKRKAFGICAVFILILLLLLGAPILKKERIQHAAGRSKRLPVYSVETEEAKIALTFDCAWENSDTDILLSLLSKYNVKATFFTTGDWCRRYPDDVKRLHTAGHAIENHSDQHPHVASIDTQMLQNDTETCSKTIMELTGTAPQYYRAPYGEYSDAMLTVVEDTLGLQTIQWDVDSRDWQKRGAEDMASSVTKSVQNGSILLFHNDTPNTPQALETIIPALQEKGYTFVLLPELVAPAGTPIDHTGRQQPK